MSTSNTYGYSNSKSVIITEAFRKIGALGDGEALDATRMAIGSGVLNPMVKALANHGLQLWTLDRVTIPLSSWTLGVPSISIGPSMTYSMLYKPLRLLECQRYDATTIQETPIPIVSNRDYESISNKSQTGTPTMVYYKPLAYSGLLYTSDAPDTYWRTHGSLVCTFQRQIQDITGSTDDPDFPPEWHEALIYQLAIRLAPNYGLAPNDRTALKQEARDALALALAGDQEEGSIYLRPASRDS